MAYEYASHCTDLLVWQVCHLKPKYFDGFKLHAYCGKACAKQAKAQQAASNGPTQIVTGASKLIYSSERYAI